MCLARGALLGEGPGQHEFGLEYRAGRLDDAVQGCAHPAMDGMPDPLLDVRHHVPAVALVPSAVQLFGDAAELHDKIVGEVFRRDLTALLPPQPRQVRRILAHDDARVRTADEMTAIGRVEFDELEVWLRCATGLNSTHRYLLI